MCIQLYMCHSHSSPPASSLVDPPDPEVWVPALRASHPPDGHSPPKAPVSPLRGGLAASRAKQSTKKQSKAHLIANWTSGRLSVSYSTNASAKR